MTILIFSLYKIAALEFFLKFQRKYFEVIQVDTLRYNQAFLYSHHKANPIIKYFLLRLSNLII